MQRPRYEWQTVNVGLQSWNSIMVKIEDNTWSRGDTTFIFGVEKFFTSECSEQVKYFST